MKEICECSSCVSASVCKHKEKMESILNSINNDFSVQVADAGLQKLIDVKPVSFVCQAYYKKND